VELLGKRARELRIASRHGQQADHRRAGDPGRRRCGLSDVQLEIATQGPGVGKLGNHAATALERGGLVGPVVMDGGF
jgi:hypothetical protein